MLRPRQDVCRLSVGRASNPRYRMLAIQCSPLAELNPIDGWRSGDMDHGFKSEYKHIAIFIYMETLI